VCDGDPQLGCVTLDAPLERRIAPVCDHHDLEAEDAERLGGQGGQAQPEVGFH